MNHSMGLSVYASYCMCYTTIIIGALSFEMVVVPQLLFCAYSQWHFRLQIEN